MEIIKTDIEGLLVLKPQVHGDARGYFFESYVKSALPGVEFMQDNESLSSRGVIRGLHFQCPPHAQAKLVRCTRGEVLDVAIDLRKGSPTYGRHFAIRLSEENHLQLFLPRGFAHGFAVLSEQAVCQYKCDNYYAPDSEGGISILDPALGIDWGIDPADAILSAKDRQHPLLQNFTSPFIY